MATLSAEIRDEIIACIPSLRAFAASLAGGGRPADDLVQDALVKAWSNISRFQAGTNMKAWLFTILRNTFYSDCRKRKREVQDVDGQYSSTLAEPPGQIGHLDFEDFRDALAQLPDDQREALILICASGFSYEEAAEICECAVGTMKSRVNRARNRLSELLRVDSANDFGPDQSARAAVTASAGGMEKISAMD